MQKKNSASQKIVRFPCFSVKKSNFYALLVFLAQMAPGVEHLGAQPSKKTSTVEVAYQLIFIDR